MVFKPFRPPLIRKPPPPAADSATITEDATNPHPSKRPRLSEGEDQSKDQKRPALVVEDKATNGKLQPRPAYRRPLIQVKNLNGELDPSEHDSTHSTTAEDNDPSQDVEAYYNVLWLVVCLNFISSTSSLAEEKLLTFLLSSPF
jgi:DNA repair and recombination protein RAD54B